MATTIELDEALVADAIRVTGQPDGRSAVEEALRAHVRALDQKRAIRESAGIGWDGPSLDELRASRF